MPSAVITVEIFSIASAASEPSAEIDIVAPAVIPNDITAMIDFKLPERSPAEILISEVN